MSSCHPPIPTIIPSHLLRHPDGEASICLLESPPHPDALCDLLLSQLRGDAADGSDGGAAASAWARLAALVYHYRPPRWATAGRGRRWMEQVKRWGTLGELLSENCLGIFKGKFCSNKHILIEV